MGVIRQKHFEKCKGFVFEKCTPRIGRVNCTVRSIESAMSDLQSRYSFLNFFIQVPIRIINEFCNFSK